MTGRKILMTLLASAAFCAAGAQQSIEQVLARVEACSPALRARSEMSRARTLEARVGNSLPDPEVEYIHSWGSPSALGKQGELTVTQQFDFPSAYALRNRSARQQEMVQQSELAAVRQDILLEARLLCIDIVALRQLIEVQKSVLAHSEQIERIQIQRLERGDAAALETGQAQLQRITEANALRRLQMELDESQRRLQALCGGEPLDFTAVEFEQPEPLPDLQTLKQAWSTLSPDNRTALSELEAARAGLRVSRSESLPRFTLGYKHEFAAGERFHGVVAGMSIPMFGNRNNVQRSKAQLAYAQAEAEAVSDRQLSELEALYEQAVALADAVRSIEDSGDEAESYARGLDNAVQAGQMGMVEYFVQMNALLDVRSEAIGFRRDYLKTCARLTAVYL